MCVWSSQLCSATIAVAINDYVVFECMVVVAVPQTWHSRTASTAVQLKRQNLQAGGVSARTCAYVNCLWSELAGNSCCSGSCLYRSGCLCSCGFVHVHANELCCVFTCRTTFTCT